MSELNPLSYQAVVWYSHPPLFSVSMHLFRVNPIAFLKH